MSYDDKYTIIGNHFNDNDVVSPEIARTTYEYLNGKTSFANRKNSNGKYVPGYHFHISKVDVLSPLGTSADVHYYGKRRYSGQFVCIAVNSNWMPVGWNEGNVKRQMEALGATAWKMMRPDKPDFSLAQSVLELKDLVNPLKNSVKGFVDREFAINAARQAAGRSTLSKTGQWWLGIQFGWLPILSDVLDFIQLQKTGQGRIDQLMKDEGKPVRRRRTMPNDSSDSSTYSSNTLSSPWNDSLRPSFVTSAYGSTRGTNSVQVQTIKRTWCVGQFRYMLPPGPRGVEYNNKLLRRNAGIMLTPSLVYNLMPWTFLLDYFGNLGDLFDNLSQGVSDRLTADWAYVMQEHKHITVFDSSMSVRISSTDNTEIVVSAGSVRTVTMKSRYAASPFGFGLKTSDLSAMQLSILGALGVSRLR